MNLITSGQDSPDQWQKHLAELEERMPLGKLVSRKVDVQTSKSTPKIWSLEDEERLINGMRNSYRSSLTWKKISEQAFGMKTERSLNELKNKRKRPLELEKGLPQTSKKIRLEKDDDLAKETESEKEKEATNPRVSATNEAFY